MDDSHLLTIGKVVKLLEKKFPDLTVSKIRFLEAEGLLSPKRTPSGYRLYATSDIERLKSILLLQEEKFLPLSVIKERFQNEHANTSFEAIEMRVSRDGEEVLKDVLPVDQAAKKLQVTPTFLRELADAHIIGISRSKSAHEYVKGSDFPLIRLATELAALGLSPRNLRQYVNACNREAGVFEQILAPIKTRATRGSATTTKATSKRMPRTQKAQEEYDAKLRLLISLTQSLHEKLLARLFEIERIS